MELNDVELNKLHAFLVLYRTGSLTQAGKLLLRTPSAISQSIARLEQSLGVHLFRRA